MFHAVVVVDRRCRLALVEGDLDGGQLAFRSACSHRVHLCQQVALEEQLAHAVREDMPLLQGAGDVMVSDVEGAHKPQAFLGVVGGHGSFENLPGCHVLEGVRAATADRGVVPCVCRLHGQKHGHRREHAAVLPARRRARIPALWSEAEVSEDGCHPAPLGAVLPQDRALAGDELRTPGGRILYIGYDCVPPSEDPIPKLLELSLREQCVAGRDAKLVGCVSRDDLDVRHRTGRQHSPALLRRFVAIRHVGARLQPDCCLQVPIHGSVAGCTESLDSKQDRLHHPL